MMDYDKRFDFVWPDVRFIPWNYCSDSFEDFEESGSTIFQLGSEHFS